MKSTVVKGGSPTPPKKALVTIDLSDISSSSDSEDSDGNKKADNPDRFLKAQEKAFKLFAKLDKSVGIIDKLYTEKAKTQEKEFLTAYRDHMAAMQREMTGLKQTLDDNGLKIKRDALVKKTKEECLWFKKEALNLTKINRANKAQISSDKMTKFVLSEDKEAL